MASHVHPCPSRYVEPPLNRRREYFDMALHILFLILLFQSVSEKRTLRDA